MPYLPDGPTTTTGGSGAVRRRSRRGAFARGFAAGVACVILSAVLFVVAGGVLIAHELSSVSTDSAASATGSGQLDSPAPDLGEPFTLGSSGARSGSIRLGR